MNTITIPMKEYKKAMQTQKTILSRLDVLQEIVFQNAKDEINPILVKKYEKISSDIDAGKGKKFTSSISFKKYLQVL